MNGAHLHRARLARRLLLKPLQLAIHLADEARARRAERPAVTPEAKASAEVSGPLEPGISIVIPERANPNLLEDCLRSAITACRFLSEPTEIIVVVNGSPAADYELLRAELPEVRWQFFVEGLGYSGAIRAGLRAARFGWVYLLNNDMVLDSHALAEVARWRATRVFAIASQIFFSDTTRRREETGWADLRLENGLLDIFERTPEDDRSVRGNLYAGGGSSLFQKHLLQRFMGGVDPYSPFYWEDVEWGTRAQRLGYDVLFCPTSKTWHRHRGTVGKLYAAAEIDRIFARNRILFHLRNLDRLVDRGALFRAMLAIDRRSFLELVRPRQVLGVLRTRLELAKWGIDDSLLPYATAARFQRPPSLRERPRVLVVSPYAMLPPKHGSAVRTMRLLREIARTHDIIVVSDEPVSYDKLRQADLVDLHSLHPIGGRPEQSINACDRIDRIRTHSHPLLCDMVHKRIACDHPAIVQIEHVELSALAARGKAGAPWCLHLQDVLIAADGSEADRIERQMTALHDCVVACSEEDAALIEHPATLVLPACADFELAAYRPSPVEPRLLFLGPFRYPPNLLGIRAFLDQVWPRLLEELPGAQLDIFGGDEGPTIAAADRRFSQRGIRVRPFVAQPRAALDACALTVNPIQGNRGSALKVIESLAAGRVCITTEEGARGFRKAGFRSLIGVQGVADMLGPVLTLLRDTSARHALEYPDAKVLARFRWSDAARRLTEHWATAHG